jgi:alpha-mannosidase
MYLLMIVSLKDVLFFQVSVPALGYNTYFLSKSSHVDSSQISSVETFASGSVPEDTTLDNGHLTLTFNNNGLLSSIRSADFQQSMPVQQNLAWYQAEIDNQLSSSTITQRGKTKERESV